MFAGKVLGGYESTFSREHLSHSEGANNTLTFRVFCLDNGEPLIVNAEVKVGSSESQEFIIYEPEIFAFGIGTSNVGWNFSTTRSKGVYGNKRGLNLIIKSSQNCPIKGRFLLGAEVEVYIDRWLKIPLSKKREDQVANAEYNLST